MGIRRRPAAAIGSQLDACARNRIIGMMLAGAGPTGIRKKVRKTDNSIIGDTSTVRKVIRKFKANPKWRGERKKGTGRTPLLSQTAKDRMLKIVFDERGSQVVTIKYMKTKVPEARTVSRQTISRALHEAGLAWLRRRLNQYTPKDHIGLRMRFCRWLLRQAREELKNIAFVDGTTYYLALSETQAEDQERGRLGKFVWRDAAGKDGLFTDNVGPSLYAAKQGKPVKVWGMLCRGRLCIEVLPEDPNTKSGTAHMNGARYQRLISRVGKKWLRQCHKGRLPHSVSLVQDHERCLWADKSIECLSKNHFRVLEDYPPSSPDLNVIEGVWAHLRKELNERAPVHIERREDFIKRLHAAVRVLNTSKMDTLLSMCDTLQERARDVIYLKGARTGW
jgi:transposase